MPRDSQRSKLYSAEQYCHWTNSTQFHTVPRVQEFVEKVLNSKWLLKKYPSLSKARIEVRDGRGRRKACGSYAYIKLPYGDDGWARTTHVVLHELTHSFMTRVGIGRAAPHGREFARLFLELVRHFMGKQDYLSLKAAFKKFRVKFSLERKKTDKPKRVMPPAAIEALKHYREQKKMLAQTGDTWKEITL
jgi:putative metallohydrolase (TIGR04338 family)